MQSLAATPFAFVDTPAALAAAVARLAGAREVAVDLEHHSFRSYQVPHCAETPFGCPF